MYLCIQVSLNPPLKPIGHKFLHVPVLDDLDDVGRLAQNRTVSQHGRGVERDIKAFGARITGAVEAGGVAMSGAVGSAGVVVGAVDLAVIGAGTIDFSVIDGNFRRYPPGWCWCSCYSATRSDQAISRPDSAPHRRSTRCSAGAASSRHTALSRTRDRYAAPSRAIGPTRRSVGCTGCRPLAVSCCR